MRTLLLFRPYAGYPNVKYRPSLSFHSIAPALGDARIVRPGKWRPARCLGWILILVFGVVLTFGPATEAISHALPSRPAYYFLAKALGALIVLCAYALLVWVGEGRKPSELALAAAPIGILGGLFVGGVMFAAVGAILVGAGLYDMEYHGPVAAWQAGGLALESSVLEEVLVRGVILRLVWRGFGPVPAFVASGVLFGVGHIANPGATLFTTTCVAIEAGVMLGAFYALTGRLWVSIGVHAGWNFTQGYLFGARVSGGDFGDSVATSIARRHLPDLLTGGAFGPEASVAALVVCTPVGAGVLWLAWRTGRFSEPLSRQGDVEARGAKLAR